MKEQPLSNNFLCLCMHVRAWKPHRLNTCRWKKFIYRDQTVVLSSSPHHCSTEA